MSSRLRLPNPPPLLIGRDADLAALVASPAKLILLHGPRGLGATAVILELAHQLLGDGIDRARYLELDREDIAVAIVEAFGEPASASAVDRAFELAEQQRAVMVIDGGSDAGWRLVSLAARFARHSRWLVATQELPDDAVLEYAHALAPLDATALTTLVERWYPTLDVHERELAVTSARGSPKRLKRMLAARLHAGPQAFAGDELSAASVGALAVLHAAEVPIAVASLLELVPELTVDELAILDEAGHLAPSRVGRDDLVVLLPSGHQVLLVRAAEPAAPLPLAHALERSQQLASIVEAIRLALAADDATLAVRWLARYGQAAIAAGHAARLATILGTARDGELFQWRLRAALELGDGRGLPAASDGARVASEEDRLRWAEILMRTGDLDGALAVTDADSDPSARLVTARAHAARGEIELARHELAQLFEHTTLSPSLALRATGLSARVEALDGNAAAAREILARIEPRGAPSPKLDALDLLQTFASVHHELGELDAAELYLDKIDSQLRGATLDRFVLRRSQLLRACIAIDRGAFDRAEEIFAALDAAAGFSTVHGPFTILLRAQIALGRGNVTVGTQLLATLRDDDVGRRYLGAWTGSLVSRFAILDGCGGLRPPCEGTSLWPRISQLHHARVGLRTLAPSAPIEVVHGGPLELQFAAGLYEIEHALLHGQPRLGLTRAHALAALAATSGFAIHELEALALVVDAAIVTHEHPVRDLALEQLTEREGSTRFADDAEVMRELVGRKLPERLERFGRGVGAGARRARYALGNDGDADALDVLVVSALGLSRPRIIAGPHRGSGWGVDRRRQLCWLTDGTTVELGDKPQLWRLLETLVRFPEHASKTQLVEDAWEMSYHPLRHDKLLHNAIHKLRKLLGAHHVVTSTDGYRLGDTEPCRLVE